MAEPDKDENGCPLPPMDHLKRGEGTATAMSALTESEFDRVGGNPGPKVAAFGVEGAKDDETQKDQPPNNTKPGGKTDASGEKKEQKEDPKTPEEKMRREAMDELVAMLPHLNEDWLEKCVEARIVKDKWDLPRTGSWILDFENMAPRKEAKKRFSGDLGAANDYNTIKALLKGVKQDNLTPEYLFYSALKLSHKFPQFSMYSLRQILIDFEYSYPTAVFAIVEGLEEVMMKERKTWKDWERNQVILIKIQRDGKWYLYPLAVVKGEKTWSKKKSRSTPFPSSLTHEIRLVEKALYFYEQKCRALLSKLDAEHARRLQLEEAQQSGTAMECPICMEEYLAHEQVMCSAGDEFCMFCLQRSVDEALIGQLKLSPEGSVPCCLGNCNGVFSLAALCHSLPGDRLAKLEERIWTDFLARAELPNLSTCYSCGYAEEIEIPMEQLTTFECRKCKRKWCRKCRSLWDNHEGKTCEEMSGDPEEMLRKKFDEMMTETVIRTCNKCKRPLEKVIGCNKLVCQCGAFMCYLCRNQISGYDHFCQHPLNPGEPCGQCTKCKLWEDPEKADKELRRKLQMQMQEELFELKLAKAGKQAVENAKKEVVTGKDSAPVPPPGPQPPPAPPRGGVLPQERQFAAIFG